MKRLLMLFTCAVFVSTSVPAQVGEIRIYHIYPYGATAAQFKLEIGSLTYLGETWNAPAVIGNALSGVSLGYGECMPAPTYLGTISVMIQDPDYDCTDIRIVPDPSAPSGEIEIVDCDFNKTYVGENAFRLEADPCRPHPPAGFQPPDEAVEVDLNPTLTWTWEPSEHCPEGCGVTVFSVYLGVAGGDLEHVGGVFDHPQGIPRLAVGPLAPLTQYQWQVKVVDDYWNCSINWNWSPVYSFTTKATSPAGQTSWGRIKNLYR